MEHGSLGFCDWWFQRRKFWPPVVNDVLPPSDVPPRPGLNDPDLTVTTVYSKPTDHLPADHGFAISPGGKIQLADDSPSYAWYPHVSTLVSAQKWWSCLVAALVYFWRRRMSRRRLAEYTSLAANNIYMVPLRQTRLPNNGRPRTAVAAATRVWWSFRRRIYWNPRCTFGGCCCS